MQVPKYKEYVARTSNNLMNKIPRPWSVSYAGVNHNTCVIVIIV